MKLILFILAIAFCTASPTYRGLRSLQGSDLIVEAPSQDLIGLDDLPGWSVDQSDDDFFDLNGVALQEEMTFPNEEETLPEEPEQPEESEQSDQPEEELLTQVRNTPELNSIFSFGVDTVLSQGVEDGKIPNVEFQVTGISALSSNVGNDGTLYTFGCNLANSNGSSIIDLNFTAYVDTATGRNILSSYSYVINTTTVTTPTNPSENNYQECSEEEIKTEVVQNALNYGVAQIIAIGTQAGKIPVSEFRVVSVENVWKQNLNSKTYYRCQVVLENQNKVTLNTTFTVIYNPANKETTMSSYEYTVREVETTPVNNGTNANNTDGFVGLSASEIESAEVQAVLAFGTNKIIESGYNKTKIPVSDYSITKINSVAKKNSTKNRTIYKCDVELEDVKKVLITTQFTITLNTVTQQLTLGSWSYNITNIRNPPTNNTDYTELNATEIQNADIQALLAFGTNEIIKSGNSKGKIPVSDWSITKINSVSKRDATNKKDIVYRCDVELQDAQKAVIKALFTVTFTTATKAMDMGSWSYTINLPPKYNNTTPNTNTTNPTTPNNTDTTNTTNPTTPTNNTNTTTPTTPNNTTNNTNPTPSDYTQLTAEEIQNAEVQAALAFGLNQILESGYNKSRIPVSQYSISKINSVGRKNYTKNRTIYKCDIEASDAKKAVIKAQFFVTVKTTTQALDMGSWNYTIHVPPGYNNNNNTNTNTTNPTTPNTTTPTNPNTPTNNTNTTTPTIPTTPNNTNTSTPTTPTTPNNTNPAPSDFTQLTTEEIQNAEVQAALAFGINQIIESAYNKSKIPVSQYSISKVNSVSRKNQAQKTTYKCDIEASGVNKVVIKAQFSVTVNTTTQAFAMGVWNYSVQFPNRNNTNTNTTTGAGNTTKPAETPNTTTPVNNNTTQTPAPTTPSNTTQTTNNTNSNTNTNTNTTAENFTELTASEIQNNAEVQAVLTYGSNQVIQKGIEKSKIPQSEYKISKVVSVAKSQGTGKNTYKCNVELEGANKVGVKAQYNVSIKPNTTEMTLSSYVYNVNNLPK